MSRARHRARRAGWRSIAFVLAALVALPFGVTASAAAWVDVEHDRGVFATANCGPTGYVSAATGRVLSGTALGTNLDAVAAVNGAAATNTGNSSSAQVANPLSVSALGAINAQLGSALQLNSGAQAGVLHQFALASSTGYSAGSAGGVADSGAIDLQAPTPGAAVPQFATLNLGTVLNAATGSGPGGGIAGLTNVQLALGALASYATLDGCPADWDGNITAHLARNYLIAGLSARLDSPLAASLSSTTIAGLQNIHNLVAAVAGSSGLVNSVSSATLTALSSTLSGFIKGTPVTTITLDVDLAPVQALLATPITDAQGILSISPTAGTVTVDLARLLGPSYQNSVGLNGLAPNTQLLINATALSALVTATTTALSAWVTQLTTAINAAMSILNVTIEVTVPLSVGVAALGLTVPVGTITVSVPTTSLAGLAAGTAPINTTLALTPPSCSGLTGAVICGVVNPLLTGLTSAVTTLVLKGVLGPVLATLITTALTPVPGLSTLLTNLGTATAALTSFLSPALNALFGPTAVLSLIANAQDTLSAASGHPFRTGQYSVAALRLVTLGMVSGGVLVNLAKSTVGSNGPV